MYYIGIDVSMKESALCIVDGKGKIVRETKLPTDPEIIARFIAATGLAIDRIGAALDDSEPCHCRPALIAFVPGLHQRLPAKPPSPPLRAWLSSAQPDHRVGSRRARNVSG